LGGSFNASLHPLLGADEVCRRVMAVTNCNSL
jgi:hypothetical protein